MLHCSLAQRYSTWQTNDIASKAATQADYSGALNSMFTEANQFESFGLAKFLHLEPNGGFTGCGNDLYVLTTAPTGTVLASQPDQPPDLPSRVRIFTK